MYSILLISRVLHLCIMIGFKLAIFYDRLNFSIVFDRVYYTSAITKIGRQCTKKSRQRIKKWRQLVKRADAKSQEGKGLQHCIRNGYGVSQGTHIENVLSIDSFPEL